MSNALTCSRMVEADDRHRQEKEKGLSAGRQESCGPLLCQSTHSMPPKSRVASFKRAADPLPDTLSPQLATLVSKPPDRGDWVYEIKLDGYRILARCQGGKARLFTRNSNDWTAKMASLAREVATLPSRQLGWMAKPSCSARTVSQISTR